MCKRLHVHAICLRAHIIKYMIISVICTNMRKGNKFFLKSPRPSLPLKRAPPLTPTLSPSGKREETAPPRRSEPLRSKVGGPSEVSPDYLCGVNRLAKGDVGSSSDILTALQWDLKWLGL